MDKALFDLHAHVEERHWWFVGRRTIMRRLIVQLLPPSKDTKIADVGCGTGANIAALSSDYTCIGIDTSADAVDHARENYPGVRFLHGYAPAALGETAGSADLFLLMDVIEHVPDDFRLVSELMSAAKPGALFLITVPADMTLWSPHDVAFRHYRRYDAARLRSVWEGLSVEMMLLSHFNTRLLPVVRAIRSLNRLRGEALGSEGTDLSIPAWPANRALTHIFAGEAERLQGALSGSGRGYDRGVSLIAIVRKIADDITPRSWPAFVAPDTHGPLT